MSKAIKADIFEIDSSITDFKSEVPLGRKRIFDCFSITDFRIKVPLRLLKNL